MNFRRSWNRINLSRPMNNKGMKMLGLVVWEQRMRRPLWEIHLWSCSDALNANYETQKRSETKRHATDSAIHHAMLFDLKRLFFSLIILRSSEPFSHRRKYIAVSQSPPPCFTGRSKVRGSVPCSQALPQERDFPHEGRLPKATILPFFFFSSMAIYLIFKGYFSLIFIMLVFPHCTASKLDSTHSLRETGPIVHPNPGVFYRNENDNKTISVEFVFFFLQNFSRFSFDLSTSSL